MKRDTNKILLIVLLALAIAFVASKVFRSPMLESNLNRDMFAIDTAQIYSVHFARADQPDLTLKKSDSTWVVAEGEKTAKAEPDALNNLLRTLATLKPERIVSRKQDKWKTYEVGDSASLHLTAYDRDEELLIDWYVGKESQGATYIRPADENEVYAFEGSLRSRVEKKFNDWRDKTFLRAKKSLIDKVTFHYPADSGFVLEKQSKAWMIDGQKADSLKVDRFLSRLQARSLSDFADTARINEPADLTMRIEGNSMSPIGVRAWQASNEKWILASDLQKDVYFASDRLPDDLMVRKKDLVKDSN